MHTIRLRGPWDQEPLQDGQIRWTRCFHRPTGLDPGSRVWLVIEDTAPAELSLNGRPLRVLENTSVPERVDITALLQDSNKLALTIPSAGAVGSIRLEMEENEN